MDKTTESASTSAKTEKEGVLIKGKDVIFLDAPEICFAEAAPTTEDTDTKLKIKPYGDGLYYIGGDLFCVYPLLSTEITDTSVKFEYEKYFITVSWTNSGDKRINPSWQRQYKI